MSDASPLSILHQRAQAALQALSPLPFVFEAHPCGPFGARLPDHQPGCFWEIWVRLPGEDWQSSRFVSDEYIKKDLDNILFRTVTESAPPLVLDGLQRVCPLTHWCSWPSSFKLPEGTSPEKAALAVLHEAIRQLGLSDVIQPTMLWRQSDGLTTLGLGVVSQTHPAGPLVGTTHRLMVELADARGVWLAPDQCFENLKKAILDFAVPPGVILEPRPLREWDSDFAHLQMHLNAVLRERRPDLHGYVVPRLNDAGDYTLVHTSCGEVVHILVPRAPDVDVNQPRRMFPLRTALSEALDQLLALTEDPPRVDANIAQEVEPPGVAVIRGHVEAVLRALSSRPFVVAVRKKPPYRTYEVKVSTPVGAVPKRAAIFEMSFEMAERSDILVPHVQANVADLIRQAGPPEACRVPLMNWIDDTNAGPVLRRLNVLEPADFFWASGEVWVEGWGELKFAGLDPEQDGEWLPAEQAEEALRQSLLEIRQLRANGLVGLVRSYTPHRIRVQRQPWLPEWALDMADEAFAPTRPERERTAAVAARLREILAVQKKGATAPLTHWRELPPGFEVPEGCSPVEAVLREALVQAGVDLPYSWGRHFDKGAVYDVLGVHIKGIHVPLWIELADEAGVWLPASVCFDNLKAQLVTLRNQAFAPLGAPEPRQLRQWDVPCSTLAAVLRDTDRMWASGSGGLEPVQVRTRDGSWVLVHPDLPFPIPLYVPQNSKASYSELTLSLREGFRHLLAHLDPDHQEEALMPPEDKTENETTTLKDAGMAAAQDVMTLTKQGVGIGTALAMNRRAAKTAAEQFGVEDSVLAVAALTAGGPLVMRGVAAAASEAGAEKLAEFMLSASRTAQVAVGVELGLQAADTVLDRVFPAVVAYVKAAAGDAAAALVTPEVVARMLGMGMDNVLAEPVREPTLVKSSGN